MLDLRFPWLWLGLGWLIVIAICIGSLLPEPPDLGFTLNDKLIHFTSYFLLTVWFSGLYSRVRYYMLITVIVVALGVALDAMQGATATRQFDLFDILANSAGAIVGFVLSILLLGGWCSRIERWIAR
jgi:VanZ family protein